MPDAYKLDAEPDIVRWLTTTTGFDRIGGDADINYGLEDRGHGFVLVPISAIARLMRREEDENGCVTRSTDRYTMWIDGLDYPLDPVRFGDKYCPDHGDVCDLGYHGVEEPTVGGEVI